MIIWDYPINTELVRRLKKEYRLESIDKGNTWRSEGSINYLWYKIDEEYREILSAHSRELPNGVIQSEIIDLIEVLGMLYWRLERLK